MFFNLIVDSIFHSTKKDPCHCRSSCLEVFLGEGVLKICTRFKCQSVILMTLICSFIEITLRYENSPVNLLHIFRTSFPKNSSRWLLLSLLLIISYCKKLDKLFIKFTWKKINLFLFFWIIKTYLSIKQGNGSVYSAKVTRFRDITLIERLAWLLFNCKIILTTE